MHTFSGFDVSIMRLNSPREGEGICSGQALTLPAVIRGCPSIKAKPLLCSPDKVTCVGCTLT